MIKSENLSKAIKIFCEEKHECVCVGDGVTLTSDAKGISFLFGRAQEKIIFKNGAAADKIVGKAAAYLFVLLGIKSVYAEVISESAISVLEEYKIEYKYNILTKYIVNRRGDGMCPMEIAVKNATSPQEAFDCLFKELNKIKLN